MVTFSESFLTFLRAEAEKKSVVARLITQALNLYAYYPAYKRVLTTDELDYITMRADGMISYLPAGKEHRTNDRGEWSRDGRQAGKAGKVIRKVFTPEILRFIPAKEFEAFGNVYKAKFLDNGFKFILKPNTKINEVYHMSRAKGEAGLNGSCMNGDSYFDIYESCEHLEILIMVNKEDKLCGRALVWKVKHKEHGDITFMDRIYVTEDYMFDLFLNHAKENRWWRKVEYKTFKDKTKWVNPDTDYSETISIKFRTPTDFDEYPYIDTFAYGGDGWLSNNSSGYDYTYNETNGHREGDDRFSDEDDDHEGEIWDDINEEYISEDDAVCITERGERRYRNQWTHYRYAREVRVEGNSTEWFYSEDDGICQIDGYWYTTDHDDVVCRADGDYDLRDNCVYCETDSEYYESDDDDMLESEGDYYHRHNDDNVIYVQALNNKGEGEWIYLPNIDDDERVVKNEDDSNWYHAKDKRIKKVQLHEGSTCKTIHVLKVNLIKWRNRYYHKDDHRLIAKQIPITFRKRKAQKA